MLSVPPRLRRVLGIAFSLIGTYAATSVLGLAFWMLAARQFSVSAVGVAGAAVAQMTLLAVIGTLGFGTMLITELPKTPQAQRRVLVRTCVVVSAGATAILAAGTALVGGRVLGLAAMAPLAASPEAVATFATGSALAAVALVIDQCVLVIGVGGLQLQRNVIASVVKVVALAVASTLGFTDGMVIFVAWAIGTACSLPYVAWATRGGRLLESRPARLVDLSQLRGLGRAALSNQALNLVLQAPLQVLPIVVTSTLSQHENGIFTTVLQLSGIVFTVPYALAIGVFAAAEGDVAQVRTKMRSTIPLGLAASGAAIVLMYALAPLLLSVFGAQYATEGTTTLRLLVAAGVTFVLKDHFVAYRRVQERTASASLLIAVFSVAEITAATWGAMIGGPGSQGLVALVLAWLVLQFLQAGVYGTLLLRAARRDRPPPVGAAVGATAAPFLAVMAAGLFVNTVGVALARTEVWAGGGAALYAAGLAMVFAAGFAAALHPTMTSRARVLTALAMPAALQLSRTLLYPRGFAFHDELIHQQVLEDILRSGHLFTPNSLLPVTPYFPGLEIATAAAIDITGLPDQLAAGLVLLGARVLLAAAVYDLIRRITRNDRAAALGVAVYCVGPQVLFFNAQFSYQTLALPLAVAALCLYGGGRSDRTQLLPPAAVSLAVSVTHHVTALFLIVVWSSMLVIECLGRRRRRALLDLAALSVITVTGFAARLVIPGNPLPGYWHEIVASSEHDLGLFLEGTATKGVFANPAGVSSTWLEQVLMVVSVLVTFAALALALRTAPALLRRKDQVTTLLVLLAPLAVLGPLSHVARATAEVGDRSTGFTYLGVALLVGLWLAGLRSERRVRVGATVAWTATFIGAVVLGAGPLVRQVPGPYEVSADARSVDAANLEAARWEAENLPRKSTVYADRTGGLLAGAIGGMQTVRHVSSRIDASRLLLDPAFTDADVRIIAETGIRYLIVDRRLSSGLPNTGVYIESGEFGQDGRRAPVPSAALTKFDRVPGARRIYDNGAIAIYDVRSVR